MIKLSAAPWIASFNAGLFFLWGIFLPFWSLWLEGEGMSVSAIGILLGAGMLTRALGSMLLMPLAKRSEQLPPLLSWVAFASLAVLTAFLFLNNYFWLCLLTLTLNFFVATMIPVSDAIATRWVSRLGIDYGRARVSGSVAFIISSSLMGIVLSRYGTPSILYAAIGAALLTLLLSRVARADSLEDDASPVADAQPKGRLFKVLADANARRFILATALIQGAHAAYYAYGSLYFRDIGFSDASIGYLWSVGVICEMSIMIFGMRWFRSWSPLRMLILAAIAGAIRWALVATVDNVVLMGLTQSMHALTFALAQIAVIRYIAHEAPASQAISLQALYSALSLNLGTALLTFLCGALYADISGNIFWIMAGLNLLAIPLLAKKTAPKGAV